MHDETSVAFVVVTGLERIRQERGIGIAELARRIGVDRKRATLDGRSVLQAFDQAVQIFEDNYVYEEIVGMTRERFELIPEAAFREALANAIVHRTWDVQAHVRVSMFDNRVEIVSPGGFPEGIGIEERMDENAIAVTLPITKSDLELDRDQEIVYEALESFRRDSSWRRPASASRKSSE